MDSNDEQPRVLAVSALSNSYDIDMGDENGERS